MNSVLENSYAWTGSFVEAISKLSCDVANLVLSSLTLTPDPSSSPSHASSDVNSGISNDNSVPAAAVTTSADNTLMPSFAQLWQQELTTFVLFTFDEFQYLLLKIFLAIILSNVCLIYIAWYIYGARISERFMTPNTSPEELDQKVLQLKLPKEHTQRYS